ncbi:hypothetical protein GCM10009547_35800 [Sporichthya brevicatena]|uniref:Uncharacterized protein n=1 Tax=Sporichthya brevicatena TaxID=171442 RepID=A0ABN1H515_9ACTN
MQAVEAAQSDPDNLFGNFARSLRADQQRVEELESGITGVVRRFSSLQLRYPSWIKVEALAPGAVDDLVQAASGSASRKHMPRRPLRRPTSRSRSLNKRTAS